jgi:hypothetical protein
MTPLRWLPVMNTPRSRLYRVLNTPGSLYSLAVNTPGSWICHCPVMNSSESRDSSEVNTPENQKLPGDEYTGKSRFPGSEYTRESPLKSNNSSIFVLKLKLFFRMSRGTGVIPSWDFKSWTWPENSPVEKDVRNLQGIAGSIPLFKTAFKLSGTKYTVHNYRKLLHSSLHVLVHVRGREAHRETDCQEGGQTMRWGPHTRGISGFI